jgi:hypothetical protein
VFQVRESLPREGRYYVLAWLLDAALAQPHIRFYPTTHMRFCACYCALLSSALTHVLTHVILLLMYFHTGA